MGTTLKMPQTVAVFQCHNLRLFGHFRECGISIHFAQGEGLFL
jgi:hypothetical protein